MRRTRAAISPQARDAEIRVEKVLRDLTSGARARSSSGAPMAPSSTEAEESRRRGPAGARSTPEAALGESVGAGSLWQVIVRRRLCEPSQIPALARCEFAAMLFHFCPDPGAQMIRAHRLELRDESAGRGLAFPPNWISSAARFCPLHRQTAPVPSPSAMRKPVLLFSALVSRAVWRSRRLIPPKAAARDYLHWRDQLRERHRDGARQCRHPHRRHRYLRRLRGVQLHHARNSGAQATSAFIGSRVSTSGTARSTTPRPKKSAPTVCAAITDPFSSRAPASPRSRATLPVEKGMFTTHDSPDPVSHPRQTIRVYEKDHVVLKNATFYVGQRADLLLALRLSIARMTPSVSHFARLPQFLGTVACSARHLPDHRQR